MVRFPDAGRLARIVGVPMMALLVLSTTPARGDLVYVLNTTFNGDSPTSTPPWLTADFHDAGGGTVTLTLTAHLNVASEFIDDFAFNVNPSITPSSLTITQNSGPPVLASGGINNTTDNAQDVHGGGSTGKDFDVLLSWTTNNSSGNRFHDNQVATFTISMTGLTAADFAYKNSPADDLFVAAHVMGIPNGTGGTTSGAITGSAVPEPSSIALLGLGAGGLALAIRRRRTK